MSHIPRLYLPSAAENARHPLPAATAHHLTRVLRLRPGAEIFVFDGEGREFFGRLDESARAPCVQIGALHRSEAAPALAITLVPAIARRTRMEWMIEKAVELGVARIQPVLSERTRIRLDPPGTQRKLEHWQSVLVAAAAQCARARLPALAPPIPLIAALDRVKAHTRLVLLPEADRPMSSIPPPRADLALLAGPESGLSEAESDAALAAGWLPVRLGPRVLRAETAGPAALAAAQALWGDWR